MLRRLRGKFIALNMAIAAAVLLVSFSIICIMDHQSELKEVNAALDSALIELEGPRFMTQDEEMQGMPFEMREPTDQQGLPSMAPPEIGGRQGGQFRQQVPVATYVLDPQGNHQQVGLFSSASLDQETLQTAADQILASGEIESSGCLRSLGLYYRTHKVDDVLYAAFADVSAAAGWKSTLPYLVAIGFATLLLFLVISLFFSKWALRPVQEAWDGQRRFVADASHDLKTPLTVILANNSIMQESPDASIADMEQWLESTQAEAQEMQGLIDDMLTLAQLDEAADVRGSSTPGGVQKTQVDLSSLTQGKVLTFESTAFERGLVLESTIEEGLKVIGDKSQLARLVSLLLDNACKYAGVGGQVDVSLRRSADSKQVQLMVHNTGDPISPEDLPHIFDRFYRVDKARSEDASETGSQSHGLGLAIAKGITEAHGGLITVKSSQEAGTTFMVSLPL